MASSPARAGGTIEEDLAYYKAQYEQLESELQDFQQSSKELEAELERDIEASEKRERQLKERVEGLGYEVNEWQTKYKQSKQEASTAQTTLQKEITTLRDTSRTLQLKLRDIEVANDDFERQARNTTSSLEDLESKYNIAIERSVLLEEEVKAGEQERESLRIETQRLRDELSDLKIEAEITLKKLRNAEETIARHNEVSTDMSVADIVRPESAASQASATSPSSVAASTPPPSKSDVSTTSDAPTPPSPPLSETSPKRKPNPTTPMPSTNRKQSLAADANTTPRPTHYSAKPTRHTRRPSIPVSHNNATPSFTRRGAPTPRPPTGTNTAGSMPRSGSLYQIRGLIGKMQQLEERVHSARSKLPAPTQTPPRASPRNGSALSQYAHGVPGNVTIRSNRKRTSGSTTSSTRDRPRDSEIGIPSPSFRLSFGGAPPPRPESRTGATSAMGNRERPSSQASVSRPNSRTSTRTPLGQYSQVSRPRSSISGNYATIHGGYSHSHSQSISGIDDKDVGLSTPNSRRTTFDKSMTGTIGIPTPSGIPRRQSGIGGGRRSSTGLSHVVGEGEMAPPERRRKLSGVGEGAGVGETF
ncbi:MAG: NADH:ubiquinone oxidoreductase [Bogoriella megaspora]|nr:MAG: NADH:ubiquinone oxidoreductase [Bogoriella megaspora]